MLKEFKVLKSHGTQYVKNLRTQPVSDLFRGRPIISGNISDEDINGVAAICPVNAIDKKSGSIDMGRCAFCKECSFMQPERIRFTNDYRIAANSREALIIHPGDDNPVRLDEAKVRREIRKLFKGALKLRCLLYTSDA